MIEDPNEAATAAILPSQPQPQATSKGKKRKRPIAQGQAASIAIAVAAQGEEEEEQEEDYSSASPHELWCPGVRIDMDGLNLPWWPSAGAAASSRAVIGVAPRFPPPEPRCVYFQQGCLSLSLSLSVGRSVGCGSIGRPARPTEVCALEFMHSLIHPSIHSSVHPSIHSLAHLSTHPSIHPSIHSLNHSFAHPITHLKPPKITHRAEVARCLATAKLRRRLLLSASSSLPHSHTSSSHSHSLLLLHRAFHRWLRACKVLHDPPPPPQGLSDPVLPSRPACQRDLPLAQALLKVGLSPEAAAEACEALGRESVAAAAAVAGGRYDVVVAGEEGGEAVGGAPPVVVAAGASSSSSSSKKRKKKRPLPSSLDAAAAMATTMSASGGGGGGGGELLLHPASRLDRAPVLRSRHHRPCLYLPLSAPGLGERLVALEVCM